jgi:hypothetical protein
MFYQLAMRKYDQYFLKIKFEINQLIFVKLFDTEMHITLEVELDNRTTFI